MSGADFGSNEGTKDGRGYMIPSHGRGALRPLQKGFSGNPSGVSKTGEYHKVKKLCADFSVPATLRMIDVFNTTDDQKVMTVLWKEFLDRGIGPPRDHSDEDGAQTLINLDHLTDEERALLAKLLLKSMPKGDAP